MTATLFGMLRHGETEWNRAKRIQGQSESPLTEKGRNDAMGWGQALAAWGFTRIVASDLERAVETATCCNQALHLPLEQDHRLREQDWGRWVGMLIRDIRSKYPVNLADQERKGWDFTPPEGENRRQVLARTLECIAALARTYPGERILLVSHKGVLRTMAHHLLHSDYTPESLGGVDPVARGKLLLLTCTDADTENGLSLLASAHPLEKPI